LDLLEAWIPLLFGRLFHTHFAMTRHIHLVAPGELSPLYTGSKTSKRLKNTEHLNRKILVVTVTYVLCREDMIRVTDE
jgi:hypothetical protein